MKFFFLYTTFLISFIVFVNVVEAAANGVPTFHSIGIYWSPSGGSSSNEAKVQYRPLGASNWKNGLSLWYDTRDSEYRGSIVHLTPGTTYEIKLTLQNSGATEIFKTRTWNETFPIGKTIYLPQTSSKTLVISQSGTPSGYTLYTFDPSIGSATINVNHNQNTNIDINDGVSYIIIRGLKLKGANSQSIKLKGASNNIVIEENDISDWGKHSGTFATSIHGAIDGGTGVERLIVQRNKFHDPKARSRSWTLGHPRGPQAMWLYNSKGNHVFRYNEVYNSIVYNGTTQIYDDIFGGGSNFGQKGFPHRDSDIYGNYLSKAWDDAIEFEGGNMNVRIWGNFIEHNYIHIAIVHSARGPVYIWRNVGGASRRFGNEKGTKLSDDYERGRFLKAGGTEGGSSGDCCGRVYVFHNTVLQPRQPSGQTNPLGTGSSIRGSETVSKHITRNNVFVSNRGSSVIGGKMSDCANDFDYDLYNGKIDASCSSNPYEKNGKRFSGTSQSLYINPNDIIPLVFDQSTGLSNGKGYYPLDPNSSGGSLGIDTGEIIPNFNDDYFGTAPDRGAFERNGIPMEFGVNAYLKSSPPPPPPSPSSADLNSDGRVDVTDLGILLSNWGASGSADINNDGVVDVVDLGVMLSGWSG